MCQINSVTSRKRPENKPIIISAQSLAQPTPQPQIVQLQIPQVIFNKQRNFAVKRTGMQQPRIINNKNAATEVIANTDTTDEVKEAELIKISSEFDGQNPRKTALTLRHDDREDNHSDEGDVSSEDTVVTSSTPRQKRKYTPRNSNSTAKIVPLRSLGEIEIKLKSLDAELKKTPPQKPKTKLKRGRKPKFIDPLKTPGLSNNDDFCSICRDGGDDLLCCDSCPKVCHPTCHIPTLSGVPDGDFVCNFCKSKSDALDSEKQDDKHFRGSEGIHEDPKEFFKACKYLSEVFLWENQYEIRALVEDVVELDDSLLKVRHRLADNDPTPYKNSDELIKELKVVVQSYQDVLKPRKLSMELNRLKKFTNKFSEMVQDYYPNYKS